MSDNSPTPTPSDRDFDARTVAESDPRVQALWRSYFAHRDPADESTLAAVYMGTAINFALTLKRNWRWLLIDQDDAISAAAEGLLRAVRVHIPDGPIPFRRHLRFWIKCQVKKENREWRWPGLNLDREPLADEVEAALREKHAERFAAAKRKGRGVHMSFILTPTGLRSLSDRSPARDGRDIERVTRVADRSLRDPSQVVADRELMTRAMTGLVGVDRRIFRLVGSLR
jgi:hypothetical protein